MDIKHIRTAHKIIDREDPLRYQERQYLHEVIDGLVGEIDALEEEKLEIREAYSSQLLYNKFLEKESTPG